MAKRFVPPIPPLTEFNAHMALVEIDLIEDLEIILDLAKSVALDPDLMEIEGEHLVELANRQHTAINNIERLIHPEETEDSHE